MGTIMIRCPRTGRAIPTGMKANRDAFRSFVLTFLDHAEVLSPPELRAGLIEWLEAVRATTPAWTDTGAGR